MPAIVSIDGRYHGHTESAETARKLDAVKKAEHVKYRLLSDSEWEQVASGLEDRAELCKTLGTALN